MLMIFFLLIIIGGVFSNESLNGKAADLLSRTMENAKKRQMQNICAKLWYHAIVNELPLVDRPNANLSVGQQMQPPPP